MPILAFNMAGFIRKFHRPGELHNTGSKGCSTLTETSYITISEFFLMQLQTQHQWLQIASLFFTNTVVLIIIKERDT